MKQSLRRIGSKTNFRHIFALKIWTYKGFSDVYGPITVRSQGVRSLRSNPIAEMKTKICNKYGIIHRMLGKEDSFAV
jgi:hypothetical protein